MWGDKERSMGAMLHISCLPGSTGIGNFGNYAFQFVDFLEKFGIRYWQICPLSPTGYGDSPYQGVSSFAINPYFIDYNSLGINLFTKTKETKVDFAALYEAYNAALPELCDKLYHLVRNDKNFQMFCKQEANWINDYATFSALKYHFSGAPWYAWPKKYQSSNVALPKKLLPLYDGFRSIQYFAQKQWLELKTYANQHGVKLIGDLPIYPGYDSVDVWANPKIFQLDCDKKPIYVAGVPPDYFSAEGQLWGNPVYDWHYLGKTNYQWWTQRIQRNAQLFDVVRLDHFRGFDRFWKVPANSSNAINGEWEDANGRQLFGHFKKVPFIAEDLGELDDRARKLKSDLQFPGMKVLQFAFSQNAKNTYLPHNLSHDDVLYLGTHDNDTLCGWYANVDETTRDQVRRYFGISNDQVAWKMITEAYRSPCFLSILCIQDLLNLGSEARFNQPGKNQDNWQWRLTSEQFNRLSNEIAATLISYKLLYDR